MSDVQAFNYIRKVPGTPLMLFPMSNVLESQRRRAIMFVAGNNDTLYIFYPISVGKQLKIGNDHDSTEPSLFGWSHDTNNYRHQSFSLAGNLTALQEI